MTPSDLDHLGDPLPVLIAERAIRRRLLEYCRGIDRCDTELLRGVFHEDASLDYGSGFRGTGSEFAAWVVPMLRRRMDQTMHQIGDTVFDWVDATTVRTETYVYAQHVRHDADGPFLERFGGRYVDRFERRDHDTWRIAERRFLITWDALERVTPVSAPGTFSPGTRDRSDPSYGM